MISDVRRGGSISCRARITAFQVLGGEYLDMLTQRFGEIIGAILSE
jgi:hypothetical protein